MPPQPVNLLFKGNGYEAALTITGDTLLVVQVPKTGVQVLAISGATPEPDGGVRIPLGYDAPPLYLWSGWIATPGDTAEASVQPHKHFCRLSLEVVSPLGWGEPYWAEVRGCTGGITQDGQPAAGAFSCRLDPGGEVRLPRQAPTDELWLDIVMPDRVLRSFALGSMMLQNGYDWTATDLEDLPLEIRLSVTKIGFHCGTWSQEEVLELQI